MVTLLFVYYFCRLYYSMNKFHFYEFKKTRKSMSVYFLCYFLSNSYNNINLFGYSHFFKEPWNLQTKYNICMGHVDLLLSMKFRLFFGYLGIFIGILTSASIIILKDKDDILQGISQLDHLIKVSTF